MSSSSNINIVLNQGSAVKEIQNIRRQNLELNQHYVAQHSEIRKKEEKEKVRESNSGGKVETGNQNERETMKNQNQDKNNSSEDSAGNESMSSDEHIIDIMV